jgi:hypothetical protein
MTQKKRSHSFPTEAAGCTRQRLAEGDLAAVDVCSCGTLQVHIGALSLRLDEQALSELVVTFGRALAENAERRRSRRVDSALSLFQSRRRGEA